MKGYVITVARGFGSGGKEISLRLSRKLGIPCYDQEILRMASEYSGINELLFARSDEKIKGSFLYQLVMKSRSREIADPGSREFVSDDNLYNIQAEIIRRLADTESCIIVGKCANDLLRDYPNVISVYIEAPRAACLKAVMEKYDVDETKAAKMIQKTDKYRSDYYTYYTGGKKWTDPIAYDMTLNSDRVGYDDCVRLITEYRNIKFGEDAINRKDG